MADLTKPILGVFAVAAAWYLFSGGNSSAAKVGRPAPDFALKEYVGGADLKLSKYKGKVVLVNFWATWCPPCREEIPDFGRVRDALLPKGFEILGVSVDQDGASAVLPFLKTMPMSYPVLASTTEVVAAYGGIRSIPTSFLIDRQGIIRDTWEGSIDGSQLRERVAPLLKS
ncbi:MAG: TlpA family protein disulfide reductase [Candidatus Sericytochromatia bacterium]|nr:TlpA family protein disulfide reductase [Candidatus Sericytochromatia bacterium]